METRHEKHPDYPQSPPYGTERSYNGLRLAKALIKEGAQVTVSLIADAVVCAKQGQKVPQVFYSIELMLKSIIRKGEVLTCATCMDARGLTDNNIIDSAARSALQALSAQALNADKVLVF